MKVKTSDLNGLALRYCVAKCEGYKVGVLTPEEQWEKFIEGASSTELEKYAEVLSEMRDGFRTELCKIHMDGYKSAVDARAWRFDEDWGIGGPIIEREELGLQRNAPCSRGREWEASPSITAKGAGGKWGYGPTPLIAAMRAFVASRLGEEVEIPDQLL